MVNIYLEMENMNLIIIFLKQIFLDRVMIICPMDVAIHFT